jgi:GGDEF domain-containing protein
MNLRAAIAETVFVSDTNERIAVTASYGISSFPVDAVSKVDMIMAADKAMYEVKEGNRDGVKVSD